MTDDAALCGELNERASWFERLGESVGADWSKTIAVLRKAAARIEALVKENARLQTYNDSICEGSQTWVKTATSALNDLVAMKARAEAAEAERDALKTALALSEEQTTRQTVRLFKANAERDRYKKLDAEAATYVESVITMRTGFTGEPPYVGWKGLGLALNEALDERDALCRERDEAMIELNEKDARIVALATELCGANAELTAIRRGEG